MTLFEELEKLVIKSDADSSLVEDFLIKNGALNIKMSSASCDGCRLFSVSWIDRKELHLRHYFL